MSREEAVFWLRSQPEHGALAKDCNYDDPIEKASSAFTTSDEVKKISTIANVKPETKALHLSNCRMIAFFGFARQGHHVTAFEPEPSELVDRGCIQQLCQEISIHIQLFAKAVETFSSPENTFDLAYCRAALHNAKSKQGSCQEVGRLLKPGGLLITPRVHVISQEAVLPKFLNSHPLSHLYGGKLACAISNYLIDLNAVGFQKISVLHPRQSIINAFPRPVESLANEVRIYLVNCLGSTGAWFSRWTAARWATLGHLDWRDHTTGRLYSFIAIKPR